VLSDYDFRDHLPDYAAMMMEVEAQYDKWGEQLHDNFRWNTILMEEVGESAEASLDGNDDHLYVELIQVAAVAVNYARTIRLRYEPSNQPPDE
jgi:NTP pyrophosphatase (non-canonical NTP hydrolase)